MCWQFNELHVGRTLRLTANICEREYRFFVHSIIHISEIAELKISQSSYGPRIKNKRKLLTFVLYRDSIDFQNT